MIRWAMIIGMRNVLAPITVESISRRSTGLLLKTRLI
jgi:hypothetical protein